MKHLHRKIQSFLDKGLSVADTAHYLDLSIEAVQAVTNKFKKDIVFEDLSLTELAAELRNGTDAVTLAKRMGISVPHLHTRHAEYKRVKTQAKIDRDKRLKYILGVQDYTKLQFPRACLVGVTQKWKMRGKKR